jgi:hypothetical protein
VAIVDDYSAIAAELRRLLAKSDRLGKTGQPRPAANQDSPINFLAVIIKRPAQGAPTLRRMAERHRSSYQGHFAAEFHQRS